MEVVTFVSANHGAVARILMPMPAAKGKMAIGWNPVLIHAKTEDEAREKAVAFYHSEIARLSQSAAAKEARLAKAAEARASKKASQ